VKEPRGLELISRYKKFYHIPANADITEDMILRHWEMEKRLTKELMGSNAENRWETFERCYSTLFSELEWLNQFVETDNKISPYKRYRDWVYLIGKPPKRIYEIGSGKGGMISYLASCGFDCKATEITHERGQRFVPQQQNLSWGISDGVHLDKFEAPDSYDVVISDQVIEHLHPDDLYEHFKGIEYILSSEGRYIFKTPHKFIGPGDVSKVFKCSMPMGMHLKEYTYGQLKGILLQAGFGSVYAVFRVPLKISFLGLKPRASRIYFGYLCFIEKLISLLPDRSVRSKLAWLATIILFSPSIFIVAQKIRT